MTLHSYDDWSPLRDVVVGSARNYTSHERELSFDVFFHDHLFRSEWAYPRLAAARPGRDARSWEIKRRYVDELVEDVEMLAGVLASLGVQVRRPMTLPPDQAPIAGMSWQAAPTPALNIRDNTLILGDEIIETPPAIRSRYLETRLLAAHFAEFFDAGATWTTMPRPLLTDASFDLSYARDSSTSLGGPTEPVLDPVTSSLDVGFEMMLDGAQCLRLGQDLVINIANTNHERAAVWLERHLAGRFRVHRVHRMSDNHIDSMVLALRPGVFLARHPGVRDLMPEVFRSWTYLVPPEPDPSAFPRYDDGDLVLTSPYIDLNVLSVDEETVLVNAECPGVIGLLEHNGFTVVPVQHRHRRLFGGGFHCFTLDTVRDGGCEDYR
ncbi:glycine amidinotransferase [Cellulomonas triticagri]|uniref:Glycine amidinotransferase n=1 Tax=Cellulomonas triticagri TaxID=2483352 RepID=A0A3M2JPS2_9CELL|nr:glycine amidinotransferase [Cellulomonas triticagri]